MRMIFFTLITCLAFTSCHQPKQQGRTEPWSVEQAKFNKLIEENSDIITYHCYGDKNMMTSEIEKYKKFNRPILCTEWLNRPRKSLIADIMPMLKEQRVGSFMWGFVNGKTQTHLPWGHRPENLPYSGPWQHDLYYSNFEPYDAKELVEIKNWIK